MTVIVKTVKVIHVRIFDLEQKSAVSAILVNDPATFDIVQSYLVNVFLIVVRHYFSRRINTDSNIHFIRYFFDCSGSKRQSGKSGMIACVKVSVQRIPG